MHTVSSATPSASKARDTINRPTTARAPKAVAASPQLCSSRDCLLELPLHLLRVARCSMSFCSKISALLLTVQLLTLVYFCFMAGRWFQSVVPDQLHSLGRDCEAICHKASGMLRDGIDVHESSRAAERVLRSARSYVFDTWQGRLYIAVLLIRCEFRLLSPLVLNLNFSASHP
jgi:hypothetical protein